MADEVNRLAEELNQPQKEKENLEKVIRQSNVGGEFLADETLEQLQDILRQEEGQRETAAVSTQTEVRHKSKGSKQVYNSIMLRLSLQHLKHKTRIHKKLSQKKCL